MGNTQKSGIIGLKTDTHLLIATHTLIGLQQQKQTTSKSATCYQWSLWNGEKECLKDFNLRFADGSHASKILSKFTDRWVEKLSCWNCSG